MPSALEIIRQELPKFLNEPHAEGFKGTMEALIPMTPEDIGLAAALGPAGRVPGALRKAGAALAAAGYTPEADAAFVGQMAKLAPNLLQRAKELIGKGATSRQIWDETKWFTGPEGKLRYEIPDNDLRFRVDLDNMPRSERFLKEQVDVPLMGILSHPALQKAYPQIGRDYRGELLKLEDWLPDNAESGLHAAPMPGSRSHAATPGRIEIRTRSPQGGLSTAVHELQHAIQSYEGFPSGGRVQDFYSKDALEQALERARLDPELRDPITGDFDFMIEKKLSSPFAVKSPLHGYLNLAGEAEARTVEKRRLYSPEQRNSIFPLDDWAVPLDELIFKRGNR